MKRLILFLICIPTIFQLNAQEINVIPKPTVTVTGKGQFAWGKNYSLIAENMSREQAVEFMELIDDLSGSKGKIDKNYCGKRAVRLVIDKSARILCSNSSQTSTEAYELSVKENIITIKAISANGIFYAIQTLQQLAENMPCHSIQAVTIADSPRFAYRGFMLDVSRHFFNKEFVKKQIKALASFKINRLHMHLTDAAGWRIEIKKYPQLTEKGAWRSNANWKEWWNKDGRKYLKQTDPGAYGGYYTQKDMKEIIDFAKKYHITIIPEIEFPGHSEEVFAAFPELCCAGETYKQGEFCSGNPDVFTFADNVLKEISQLFPSEYIHIGGDEASKSAWKKCPKCQATIKANNLKNENELQSYFIEKLEIILHKYNKKLLGWDEILEGGLAPNATVMSWRGQDGGIQAAQMGHHAIMTPGKYCYFDSYQDNPLAEPEAIGGYLPLESVYEYNPVPDTLQPVVKDYIMGVQTNLWTEYIPTEEQCEYMIYPRIMALAETGWSKNSAKDWNNFKQRALLATQKLRAEGYNAFNLQEEKGNKPEYYKEIDHLARGKKVTYNLPYNSKYCANGDKTLTDGIKGGWTYGDNRWQGFIGRGRIDVVIDLEEVKEISQIKAEFMQAPGPEVYYPGHIEIFVSQDGVNYSLLHNFNYPASAQEPFGFKDFGWSGKAKARYIRYKANCGKASGFQFVDEIIVL